MILTVRNKELFVGKIHAVTYYGKAESIEKRYSLIKSHGALSMENTNAEMQSKKQQEKQCCATDLRCETSAVARIIRTALLRHGTKDLCNHSTYHCLAGCKAREEK